MVINRKSKEITSIHCVNLNNRPLLTTQPEPEVIAKPESELTAQQETEVTPEPEVLRNMNR